MADTNRWLVWLALVGTAASVVAGALFWMILMHPVAVAQALAAR